LLIDAVWTGAGSQQAVFSSAALRAPFIAKQNTACSAPLSASPGDGITTQIGKGTSMTKHYTVTVPVEGNDGKTRFRRVGAAFVNRDGAKAAMSIKLDFPVGATEFALFEPRSNDVDGDVTE